MTVLPRLDPCYLVDDFLPPINRKLIHELSSITNIRPLSAFDYTASSDPPDYSIPIFQLFYSLKYSVAYCFQYYHMYRSMLNLHKFGHYASALSLGSGSGIDGFAFMLATSHYRRSIYSYWKGVDSVHWAYRIPVDHNYYEHIQGDVADTRKLRSTKSIDIIMFPKSLADFSAPSFEKLQASLSYYSTEKTTLFIAAAYSSTNTRDIERQRLSLLATAISTSTGLPIVGSFIDTHKTLAHFYYIRDAASKLYAVDWPTLTNSFCVFSLDKLCNQYKRQQEHCLERCHVKSIPISRTIYLIGEFFVLGSPSSKASLA